MKKKLLLFIMLLCTFFVHQNAKAQTLAPGDIAFVGYQTGSPTGDGFSFITLKAIPAGTAIYFTEKGWGNGVWANSTETHLLWNVPTLTPVGTIISIVETAADTFTITGTAQASVTIAQSTNFNLSAGDQILAYQSPTGFPEPASPTFIAGIHGDYNATNYDPVTTWNLATAPALGSESSLPPGLTNGVNCISLFPAPGPEIPNSKYTGALTGSKAVILASINNPANWTHHATNDLGITPTIPTNYPAPSITLAVAPTVTSSTATNIKSVSATLGGDVTADGGDATIEKGIVWATTVNPTIANNKFQIGTGTGPFGGVVTGFPAATTIYFRAYATNTGGTSYGAESNFTTGAALTALATIAKTNVSCNAGSNGTATVAPSGGSTPYSYSWAPSGGTNATASGLSVGVYTVTVTDGEGTQITRSTTITQPSVLIAVSATTNVACNGGSNGVAAVSASGGAGGYTYLWNNGATTAAITGLTAGTYSVTVTDANSCAKTLNNIQVTQPSALNASSAVTNVSCNGGTNGVASVTASGGAGGYSYLWNNGATTAAITGRPAGIYSVTVTDANSCFITLNNITITQPPVLGGTASTTSVSCFGGSNGTATVTPSGGAGSYTYLWSTGATTATVTGRQEGTYSVTITDANSCTFTVSNITINQPTAPLNGTTVVTNIACNGGSTGVASVTPIGGTSPYTVLWSNGATTYTTTGLLAGIYSVTITDANTCIRTINNINVTQPSVLNAVSAVTNVACNGGANGVASVTAAGGAGGYTYLWNNGATTSAITGLTAGTYSVTVTDANSCTKTVNNIGVSQPTVINGTTSTTPVSCFGGSNGQASVTATGGVGGYTYSWSPSGGTAATATGLTAGTYSVTITDANACTKTITGIVVNGPVAALIATPAAQTNILCNGSATGSATVASTGGTGTHTYSWSPTGGTAATATGLTAGTYTVTVKDANLCQTTQSFTITQPAALTASASAQTNIACNGATTGSATVSVTGGTGAYTYSWAPSGGTAATASGLAAGTYTVTVTDANLCFTTQSFTITQPTVLAASKASTGVSCFGGSNGTASVTVSGGTPGYTYLWAPLGGSTSSISGKPAGNYTCTITDANGCTLTQTITISSPTQLTGTIAKVDVSCNGGTNGAATVTPTGGVGSYTYSWSPTGGNAATASGLAQGTYNVTIQDGNTCQTSVSVTIDQPATLTASISKTNVLCNGGATGTATVVPLGGNGNYTYIWSPSGGTAATATGLTAGNYSCLVTDAKGCFVSQSVTIGEPPVLNAVTSQINATCVIGGQASINVSGGTLPYTYLWSPTGATTSIVTGLAPGNHSVLIKDANGCTLTRNLTIVTTNTLTAATSKDDVLCNGSNTGSASVIPSGAPGPFTYVWAPSGGNAATAANLTAGNYSVIITSANGCSIVKTFTITEPTAINITPSQTNLLCNGAVTGSASVVVTGGTGGYTYSWSPSGGTAATATGLAAGTYTVTVTDSNLCIKTQSFTITQPAALTATTSQTNVSCNGGSNGSATVNVTGGTGNYTYSWSPTGGSAATATGLSLGTYTVTVTDANNCSITKPFTITEPNQLTASIGNQTDVSCNGENNGSATVNVTGGTGTYTYAWSPSGGTAATASGLSPGNYTVTITDENSCTTSESVIIAEPAQLVASVGSQNNVSCNGGANGTASVNVTGGNGAYTYLWSPTGGTASSATGLIAGTYTVTIKDAKLCETTQIFIITQPDALTATTTTTDVSCNGGTNGSATVNVTGGTGNYTYSWSPTGGSAATATGLSAGNYTVTVTDANSCSITKNVSIIEPSILEATIAQTDVTCIGAADASATVTATGGNGNYTYTWSPSGGNAATATGLIAGNYTVTITDAKGCFVTKPVTIITIPDVTAPVPNVASLPAITNTCSVLASQIPVPTATDNCAGIITATTTDPLSYTAVGTYTITWTYNDGHGNTSSQNQTINVTASPLNQVTFSDASYTFDGNLHAVQVANLPAGATVVYSITPAASTLNGAINAGTYTVTAIVSPTASTPNCSPITLTAQLTVNKAAQLITFGAIPAKILGILNDFNLDATSNSGLPIRYSFTYTSALPPANVSAIGLVNLLRSGSLLIVAHQDGNENYLAAANVEQVLVIKNNDVTITKITLGNKVYQNPAKQITYVMACDENNPNVSFTNETGATFSPAANLTITTPKPGIYTQNVTVTSQDGTATATYALTIEKPFGFYDIVHQKFNNVLLINNNPQTNGGYEFVSYQWFKNGQLVGTGQYYSAGEDLTNSLDTSADFSVKMTTKDGKILQTCSAKITIQKSLTARLYPNPIQTGQVITVEADFPAEELENMQISLYTVSGQLVKTLKSSTVRTEVQLPDAESNMYVVVIETANIKKTLKVIVNK